MSKDFKGSIHDQIRANRFKTIYLFIAFPIIIIGLTYFGILIALAFSDTPAYISPTDLANEMMKTVGFWVLLGVFIWSLISYFLGSKMILAFAGAKPIQKKDHPELFRSVENVSISAGLPKTPDIYIIEDMSLNAFATGNSPKDSKVAISRGLLEKLTKAELEAVMAHEVGHILNRDIRVMLISITLVGAVQMLGELLLRTGGFTRSSDNSKSSSALFFIGLLFITIGTLLATLTKLAISREREYLADATSATLTHNPRALATALKKISENARIEVLDKKASMAGLCIADPTASGHKNHQKEFTHISPPQAHNLDSLNSSNLHLNKPSKKPSLWSRIWSTHPPMSDRIARLERY